MLPSTAPTEPPVMPPEPRGAGRGALDEEIAAPLARLLDGVRRRAARVEFGTHLVAAVGVLLATLLVGGLLLLVKQEWAREAAWIVGGLAALAVILRGALRARAVSSDDRAAARLLGRVAPHDASDLLSAVELAAALRSPQPPSGTLVRAHLARMSAVAAALDARPAVRAKPVLVAAAAVLGVIVFHAVVVAAGGARARTAWSFLAFRATDDAAPLFAPEPIAGDVVLEYRYPAYMNRPPRTVEGTAGDIAAPKGTVVAIKARADRDIEAGVAVVGTTLVPLTVQGRDVAGELTIANSGEWRFRWTTAKGRTVAEGPPRPILVEPDLAPEVRITAPQAELVVQGKERVELAFEATDDFGIGDVSLVWSLGKGAEEKRVLATLSDLPRRHRSTATWELAALGLEPGDRVTYRIEVNDNDTVSGPKKGVSSSQVLVVFSELEHHREVMRRAEEQWERLVAGLGDRLEEKASGDAPDEEWFRVTGDHDRALASVATGLRTLAAELAGDKHAPKEIGLALEHVGTRVGGAVQRTTMSRAALAKRPSAPASRALGTVVGNEIHEEEQGVLYIEDLLDRQRLMDLAELTRQVRDGSKELAKLVEEYGKAPTEEAKRALSAEVARLKERLFDLHKRMGELAREIRDEHLNEEAKELMAEGDDVMSQLDEVQKQLANGDTEAAMKALEEVQKALEKMEKSFEERSGEVDPEAAEIGRELQEVANDLLDVEAEQKALKDQSEGMRAEERKAQKERIEKLGKDFVQKQKDRAAKARKELEGLDRPIAESLALEEDLDASLERLAQLEQALQGGDFDEAFDQASRVLRSSQDLKLRLQTERDVSKQFDFRRGDLPQLEDSAGRAQRAEKPVQEVVEDLEKLMREAKRQPSPEEKQKMKEMQKRQQNAEKRTQELKERLEQIGEKRPIFGPEVPQLLDEASGKMGEAGKKLGESDARGAGSRQGEALEKLQAFREAMQQGEGQGGGGGGIPMPFGRPQGQGGGEGGQGFREEKVAIPSADESKAPEEFRRDILDAMKDSAPDRYKEQVRDYYEELVK